MKVVRQQFVKEGKKGVLAPASYWTVHLDILDYIMWNIFWWIPLHWTIFMYCRRILFCKRVLPI